LEGKRNVHVTTLIYRSLKNEAPAAINAMFQRVDLAKKQHISPHDRSTNVIVPNWTNDRLQSTLTYRAAVLWNSLPTVVQRAKNAEICRERAYNHFLKHVT
jgi:hypothetical protein